MMPLGRVMWGINGFEIQNILRVVFPALTAKFHGPMDRALRPLVPRYVASVLGRHEDVAAPGHQEKNNLGARK